MKPKLKPEWECYEEGWWVDVGLKIGVCKEDDGKWHSYALRSDTRETSPAFNTRREAMRDAEKRALSPAQCPKCGCQVMDPFDGRRVVHDVEKCRIP